jgi:3-phenylpropionate/trans-cinnamate dioxygenase ferredoxin component
MFFSARSDGKGVAMAFVRAAAVAAVAPGVGQSVVVNGKRLALFLADGRYYALDDECPHRGAPLSEGECAGGEVICPWHDSRFDLATGAVKCLPAKRGVTSYPVQVVGDEIQVEI